MGSKSDMWCKIVVVNMWDVLRFYSKGPGVTANFKIFRLPRKQFPLFPSRQAVISSYSLPRSSWSSLRKTNSNGNLFIIHSQASFCLIVSLLPRIQIRSIWNSPRRVTILLPSRRTWSFPLDSGTSSLSNHFQAVVFSQFVISLYLPATNYKEYPSQWSFTTCGSTLSS